MTQPSAAPPLAVDERRHREGTPKTEEDCPHRARLVDEILGRQVAAELEEERPTHEIAGPLDKAKKPKPRRAVRV